MKQIIGLFVISLTAFACSPNAVGEKADGRIYLTEKTLMVGLSAVVALLTK